MEDPIDRFARNLNTDPQAVAFLRDCPLDVQASVIENFDGSGSKDGNVVGRLQGYTRHLLRRSGHSAPDSLGLAAKDRPEYATGNVTTILAPGGGGGLGISTVAGCAALPEFSRRIGLTESAEQFLSRLPQEVLASVLSGFDPSGTKDGNVWGRLLGYARSHWARHLHVDQESVSYIRSLPEETQLIVMMEFDARSKDGNMAARLAAFIEHAQMRSGASAAPATEPVYPVAMPAALPAALPALPEAMSGANAYGMWPTAVAGANAYGLPGANAYGMMPQVPLWNQYGQYAQAQAAQQMAQLAMLQQWQAQPMMAPAQVQQPSLAAVADNSEAVAEFGRRMSLDSQALAFMHNLDREVANVVIAKFDPSGTKDGNVWGRLLGYIRHNYCRMKHVDQATSDQMRRMPEHEQMRMMQDSSALAAQGYAAPHTSYGGVASLQQFSEQWGLNPNAVAFLGAIPQSVRDGVIVGFDGSRTKDGNVWGRLLGFTRQQFTKSLGLDQSSTRQLQQMPEEAQMLCMSTFDSGSSKDGNMAGRLEAFMTKCLRQAGHAGSAPITMRAPTGGAVAGGPAQNADSLAHDPMVLSWLERCNLDLNALEYLQHLPEEILQQVMDGFVPTGSKDGNVLGRLQGYVKHLARKRGIPVDAEGRPAKRMRQ